MSSKSNSKSKSTKTKRAKPMRKTEPEGGELADDALDQVAGGGGEMQFDLQNAYQQYQQGLQTVSKIQKANHDNAQAIIKNLKA